MKCFIVGLLAEMGKRKLRFISQKNYERKRTAKQDSIQCHGPPSLVVSLPLTSFTSMVVPTLSSLLDRIKQLTSWSISSCYTGVGVSVFSLSRVCVENYPPFVVTISTNFTWSLFININQINLQHCKSLQGYIHSLLDSPEKVLDLLSCLETKHLCNGNPDDKFSEISKHRNGTFLSPSGNYPKKYNL